MKVNRFLLLCLFLFGFQHHISNKNRKEADQSNTSIYRNENRIFLRQEVLVHKMVTVNKRLEEDKCVNIISKEFQKYIK